MASPGGQAIIPDIPYCCTCTKNGTCAKSCECKKKGDKCVNCLPGNFDPPKCKNAPTFEDLKRENQKLRRERDEGGNADANLLVLKEQIQKERDLYKERVERLMKENQELKERVTTLEDLELTNIISKVDTSFANLSI